VRACGRWSAPFQQHGTFDVLEAAGISVLIEQPRQRRDAAGAEHPVELGEGGRQPIRPGCFPSG